MALHNGEAENLLQDEGAESPGFTTRKTVSSAIFRNSIYLWILAASVSVNVLLALVTAKLAIKASHYDPSILMYCKLGHCNHDTLC